MSLSASTFTTVARDRNPGPDPSGRSAGGSGNGRLARITASSAGHAANRQPLALLHGAGPADFAAASELRDFCRSGVFWLPRTSASANVTRRQGRGGALATRAPLLGAAAAWEAIPVQLPVESRRRGRRQLSRSDREIAIRSDCLHPPDPFLALPPLRQQLSLGSTEGGRPVTHSASAIIDLRSDEPPHGERWGARLARLGLLLVHCLLRPFLASSPSSASHLAVDTRVMRRLEPQPSTSSSSHSPTKSLVAAVFERLSMEMPTTTSDSATPTNSSSEPSPQAADTKPKSLLETKRAPSPPPSPKLQMKEPVPEQDQAQVQQEEQEQEQDDVEELKQTLLRKSTGSIAIMTRQQEAFDHRRHTFSAMSADGRANMRRRSYDLTAQFGSTFPPSSPPQQPLPHSLKAHHHLQHLRVYGKSTGPARQIGECHEEGAPMVALMSPNPDTVWTRGKPVDIEWKVLDSKVEKLCIELLEDGLSATTVIAKEAPNTGFFSYHKVPWGMESGSKYFLRVSAADAPERFRTSSFFQISSAP